MITESLLKEIRREDEAHRVHATVCPVVSDPAMKKISNSSTSRSVLSGRPRVSRSRSRCPAIDPASPSDGGRLWQSCTSSLIIARTRRWFSSARSLSCTRQLRQISCFPGDGMTRWHTHGNAPSKLPETDQNPRVPMITVPGDPGSLTACLHVAASNLFILRLSFIVSRTTQIFCIP